MSELSRDMYQSDIAASARMRAFSRDNIRWRSGITGPYRTRTAWKEIMGGIIMAAMVLAWMMV